MLAILLAPALPALAQASALLTPAGPAEALLPGGSFEMGDHYGFVDPDHPSDELPIHTVTISEMYMAKTATTNRQFLEFLNDSLANGLVKVRGDVVYAVGGSDPYYFTHQYASPYSIAYGDGSFSIVDFRADHPVVGVQWFGAAAYCNWVSRQRGLEECFDLTTWVCDFTKDGYRLPTEAEWEYAGRGGQYSPYYNYPWGNDLDRLKANWPGSGDPYEGTDPSTYPWTTPVGFYNGEIRQKSDFNWPGSAPSYATHDGANGFGLYDMAGNVWQLVYDWYGVDYYKASPSENPRGPDFGSPMPDGQPYRGMRGGNWYNGMVTDGVNNGHSRVSNRDPSYYRGPLDARVSWCMVGFRVARNSSSVAPTAVFTFDVSANTVAFTDASTGGPTSWSWVFGDGAASALQNPTHTYASPGTYTVTLTASNAHGSDTAASTVTVAPACTITGVVKAQSPFRLKIGGAGFQPGCAVLLGGQPAPETLYKSAVLVVAKGSGLKALLPKGVAVEIVVQNPDGGESAPFSYTR